MYLPCSEDTPYAKGSQLENSKRVRVQLRLPEELLAKLDARATRTYQTRTALVIAAVEQYLRQR